MIFGMFRKKPQPTALDAIIHMTYGDIPRQKRANLQEATELAHKILLGGVVPLQEVGEIAAQLYRGPIPYSTHDLALAAAMNLFKKSDKARREELSGIQISSRMAVVGWIKEKKVAPLIAKSFEDTLYKMFKPTEQSTPNEAMTSIVSLIEKLFAVQLALEYKQPRDALSALMTNNLAAGYVFGFHDSCLQLFGLTSATDAADGLNLIKASYQSIFGDQTGLALLESSLNRQDDPDFHVGRLSGGEDFAGFVHKKIPPLGLQRILILRFDAAAVWRGLEEKNEN